MSEIYRTAVLAVARRLALVRLRRHVENRELHPFEIAQDPGGRRPRPAHRAGVDIPGASPLDVRDFHDFRLVVMAAADEVPVAGGGQRPRVMGIVDEEDVAPGEVDAGILAIKTD